MFAFIISNVIDDYKLFKKFEKWLGGTNAKN